MRIKSSLSLLAVAVAALAIAAAVPAPPGIPLFDSAGRLILPADYRDWTFLTSSIDMNYKSGPPMDGGHMFGNVFAPAAAIAAFQKTGTWPDHTMLVLENRGGATKGSITKFGVFQTTELMGMEVHVKDTARFKGGWGFFAFDGTAPADRIADTASCYACHQTHAAADTTFVQFYPTLLPTAARLGTLSPSYLAESGHP